MNAAAASVAPPDDDNNNEEIRRGIATLLYAIANI